MWLSKLAPFLFLAACGYAPALAPGGSAANLHGKVTLAQPTDRNSFDLTQHLEDRLGTATSEKYLLSTNLKASEGAVGVTAEQETTRYTVRAVVTYELRDTATDKVILTGKVQNFTGYSTTDTAVSTRAAQLDAYKRLMVILGDEIVERLILSGAFAG